MSRYWIIAPAEAAPSERFEKIWQFDLANNLISIGWRGLGDVSHINKQELVELVASTYPNKPPQTKSLIANMIWAFYHEIVPGDFVIARRGRRILAGLGRVTAVAAYDPDKVSQSNHSHVLGVSWQDSPRDKIFSSIVFPMHTLTSISNDRAIELLGVPPTTILSESEELIEDTQSFVLEKYLEDFIVSNFSSIFEGRLSIYHDSEGNDGQQYNTDIGSIDILAIESNSDSFVVIELKKGRPSDQVVGQVLRYMGWVKRNLCTEGQTVKGLIICRDHDPKLSYATEMVKDVNIRYYTVAFKLLNAPRIQ